MANKDAAFGLRPIGKVGQKQATGFSHYVIIQNPQKKNLKIFLMTMTLE